MRFVTIFRAFNPMEADLVSSRLEVADFHPFVQHADAALTTEGYSLTTGGILVQVPKNEAEEARTFLAEATDVPSK